MKALIDAIGMKATPVKRKRTNGLSVPQPADSIRICPRHHNATTEVVCVDCRDIVCYSSAFDCSQSKHTCFKVRWVVQLGKESGGRVYIPAR